MHMLTNEVNQLVSILDRCGNSDSPWPIVVHVGQPVAQFLNAGSIQGGGSLLWSKLFFENDKMSWRHGT